MIGEGVFVLGERGLHVLFDAGTIAAAFEEDAAALRRAAVAHRGELEDVLGELLGTADAQAARDRIAALEPELRHVLVHVYFELLERRMRGRAAGPH